MNNSEIVPKCKGWGNAIPHECLSKIHYSYRRMTCQYPIKHAGICILKCTGCTLMLNVIDIRKISEYKKTIDQTAEMISSNWVESTESLMKKLERY